MEVRFIDHFIRRGVPRPRIRRIAERLRDERRFDHPFALRDVRFRSGLGRIFADVATETGDRQLEDLLHRQYAIFELLDDLLDKGVEFSPEGIPLQWRPNPDRFPNVALDPHFSFGSPVVVPGLIPTATLYEAVLAEGSEETAAEWYDVDPSILRQAVTFELDVVQ